MRDLGKKFQTLAQSLRSVTGAAPNANKGANDWVSWDTGPNERLYVNFPAVRIFIEHGDDILTMRPPQTGTLPPEPATVETPDGETTKTLTGHFVHLPAINTSLEPNGRLNASNVARCLARLSLLTDQSVASRVTSPRLPGSIYTPVTPS